MMRLEPYSVSGLKLLGDGFTECVFNFCTECGPLRRVHDVQGLWTTTAKGFEESGGCEIAAQRGAQWWSD